MREKNISGHYVHFRPLIDQMVNLRDFNYKLLFRTIARRDSRGAIWHRATFMMDWLRRNLLGCFFPVRPIAVGFVLSFTWCRCPSHYIKLGCKTNNWPRETAIYKNEPVNSPPARECVMQQRRHCAANVININVFSVFLARHMIHAIRFMHKYSYAVPRTAITLRNIIWNKSITQMRVQLCRKNGVEMQCVLWAAN